MGTVKDKLYSLQICRGIAACLVILYHFSESSNYFLRETPFASFFMFGHSGVSFFFVLSGFIIFYVHRKDIGLPKKIPVYLFKRAIRIYPFYWPVLIVVTAGYLIFGTHPGGFDVASINFDYFLRSAFLVEYTKHPIVVIAWTLVHEVFFYFLFLFLLLSKRLGMIIFSLWGIFIILSSWYDLTYHSSFINFIASYYNLEFLMGSIVAVIVFRYNSFIKFPYFIFLFGLICFITNGIVEVYYSKKLIFYNEELQNLIYGISSSFITLGIVKIEMSRNMLFPKIFVLMGEASYSIYLTHNYVLGVLFRIFEKIIFKFSLLMRMTVIDCMLVVSFLVSVFIGIAYYWLCERPILQYLRNKFLRSIVIQNFNQPYIKVELSKFR